MEIDEISKMKEDFNCPFFSLTKLESKNINRLNLINYSQSEEDKKTNARIKRNFQIIRPLNSLSKNINCLIINETPNIEKKSFTEMRLIKDLEEFKKNNKVGKCYSILLHDYFMIQNSNNFEMIVDFLGFFSLKFIFTSDYPFSPPLIFYCGGNKSSIIFDENGNIKLHCIDKMNWSPTLWLSSVIYSIELLIINKLQNKNVVESNFFEEKDNKYHKRRWKDYIKEAKSYYNNNSDNSYYFYNNDRYINFLEKTIKQLKISN